MVVDIDDEVIDKLVSANIRKSYELLADPRFQKGMYSMDEYENLVMVNLLRRAMERVYEYYSSDKLD